MRTNFDKDLLAVEQNDYLIKNPNFSITYDLNAWTETPVNSFKFRN